MLFWGMFLQGLALLFFVFASTLWHYIILSAILGWGTAMVYPTFLATVAENTHPHDRPKSLGVFRLWRDLGYAIGAILTGLIADAFGINTSIVVIALLTLISSMIIQKRMRCATSTTKKLFSGLFSKTRTDEKCTTGQLYHSIRVKAAH